MLFFLLFFITNVIYNIFFSFQKVDMKTGTDTGEPVGFIDVYQEFNDVVAAKHKIMKFKSMVCRSV